MQFNSGRNRKGLASRTSWPSGSLSVDDNLTLSIERPFLSGNAGNKFVPIVGKQLDLLQGVPFSHDPLEIARTLYNRVDDCVTYDKSQPGYGNGDVL